MYHLNKLNLHETVTLLTITKPNQANLLSSPHLLTVNQSSICLSHSVAENYMLPCIILDVINSQCEITTELS